MPLRMRVHDREPIGMALRRFKKLLERSGLTKELRKRKYYEKPCEARRRTELRKQSAIRKGKLLARPRAAKRQGAPDDLPALGPLHHGRTPDVHRGDGAAGRRVRPVHV